MKGLTPVKKIILALILILTFSVPTAYGEIYTYDKTEIISNGVELRRIKRFYGNYWLNITCVCADLEQPNVKLDLLKGGDCDKLLTVEDFTRTQDNVLAAANADFFDATIPSSAQGFSLGAEIKDGELLQSQIDESMAAAFYDGENLFFSYMTMNMTITAPNGETAEITHLNKHTDYYGDILMYTSAWNGGFSPAPGGEVLEVVVEDDTIVEFRRNMPPVAIPENGYVLAVSEGVNMFFANNFSVGDRIELNISAFPSFENMETVFGGGTLLLLNGEKVPFTHTIAGYSPRTCIGTNEDGTVVYIITVDGRQTVSRGVTQSELADIALELGCKNALNLDGGGSTRMMAKTFWNSELHVVNSPSENRKVINAVSIVSEESDGEAVGVRLSAERETLLVGDSTAVQYRFYDKYGNAVWTNTEEPVWSIEGVEGTVSDGIFVPESGGTAVITASYKGKASEPVYIEVIEKPSGISLPQNVNLSVGESLCVVPEVSGSDGVYGSVYNLSLLSPVLSNEAVASLSDGVLTAVSEGYSVLTLTGGDASSSMLITVGSPSEPAPVLEENVCYDIKRGEIYGGSSFSIFSFGSKPCTIFDDILYRRGLKKISAADSYGFLGEYDSELLPSGARTPIAADSFSAIDKGFALIISLPESGRLSGGNWTDMANAIASTSAKNIIVMTKTAPNGSDDETQLFYDYMDFISKAKNVFVVQSAERNSVTVRNAVRYITIGDASLRGSVRNAIESSYILRFTTDGNDCMYNFESIFDPLDE